MKLAISLIVLFLSISLEGQEFPHTRPLEMDGDLSVRMVSGISIFLDKKTQLSRKLRKNFWNRNNTSDEAYVKSIEKNRKHFQFCIGATDELIPFKSLGLNSNTTTSSLRYKDEHMEVYSVYWPVFKGVTGEGLLINPLGPIRGRIIALPDADQTPEQIAGLCPGINPESQFARHLAIAGCQVVIPTLVNRDDEFSGAEGIAYTNQTHREWIYRQAFEMGRHIIGYEVQKIRAAINWFNLENSKTPNAIPIGIVGYNEGALIGFYAAAIDNRVKATMISGYFCERDRIWNEPIYRNVFGLLEQFGDAEIASLICPRTLIVEHSSIKHIDAPPMVKRGRRGGAAPGILTTPATHLVESEFLRARDLGFKNNYIHLYSSQDGINKKIPVDNFCNPTSIKKFLKELNISTEKVNLRPKPLNHKIEVPTDRQKRQVIQLVDHTQRLLRFSEYRRQENFWKSFRYEKPSTWNKQTDKHKERFWNEVIGKFPNANLPINPRSRKILDTDKWTCHEIVLDVWKDVFAWGYLLTPKGIKPGEKRPVVVCQHGLEGLPNDTVTRDPKSRAFGPYKGFSAELADRGFVVFAPHNPYRGQDAFRVLQRKANPLGKTLFSVIIPQHNRIIDWLETLPYVEKNRIGFYGLSYGGKTAMRVPALIPRYSLSICSADFNEWIKKNTTTDWRYSYLYTGEYEIFEYNLGHTFNYAEMAALIAPRPFMVERGHKDGVAPDEWVAYEYAKVRRLYAALDIPEKTEIEFFQGPHTINGKGTFDFLHRHLKWPSN